MFKKTMLFILTLILTMSMCLGCTPTPEPTPDPPDPIVPIVPVEPAKDTRIPAPTENLFDDFKFGVGGFKESKFYINQNIWGYNNSGVKGANVGYTEDGIAVLKAYGDLTDKPGGYKRSGACLLSKQHVKPGKLEVAMKVMPRLGGCTAIWPYICGYDSNGVYQYQEIDIEIPAGRETDGNGNETVAATFENVMNTNYSASYDNPDEWGPYRSTKTECLTPANDGRWHKYGIVWETSPKPRIRYYVDDIMTSDTNDDPNGYKTVSDFSAPLQIGVWFPDGWAGDRDFDESAMLIDWVSYEEFKGQPCRKGTISPSGLYNINKYPIKPMELPVLNYLSDGDFENMSNTDQTGAPKLPWNGDFSFDLLTKDTADINSGSNALKLTEGKSISQRITGVYGLERKNDKNFKNASYFYEFDLSGYAKISANSKATIKVECLDSKKTPIAAGTQIIPLETATTGYTRFNTKVSSVSGTKSMRVTITVTQGAVLFDDLQMLLVEPKTMLEIK